jgi:hypothetical protein
MDEQLLKDLLATAEANNWNWDVVMPKFPELEEVDLQLLKDYAETVKANNYDYSSVNPKFPELFPKKKKRFRIYFNRRACGFIYTSSRRTWLVGIFSKTG